MIHDIVAIFAMDLDINTSIPDLVKLVGRNYDDVWACVKRLVHQGYIEKVSCGHDTRRGGDRYVAGPRLMDLSKIRQGGG